MNTNDLRRELRALGVRSGDLLNVKVSLRSIGRIEGGATALINALLDVVGPDGTIITDSFVDVYPLPLSAKNQSKISEADTPSYAGALSNTMIKHPASFRSPHPVQKFVGIGKMAEELTQGHDAGSPAYGLLGEMALRGGKNLKIGDDIKVPGVGTTHVAIQQLGIPSLYPKLGLYIRGRRNQSVKNNEIGIRNDTLGIRHIYPPLGVTYRDRDGVIRLFKMDWVGACSYAWLKFYPHYRQIGAIISEGKVGNASAKITDMQKTLNWEIDYIRENPKVLCCERENCTTCRLEWDFDDWALIEKLYITTLRLLYHKLSPLFRLVRKRMQS